MADYIKREQVEEVLEKAQIISSPDGEYSGYCTEDICLESIPSADVEEVRHGRWIMRGGKFRCSVCGEKANWKREGGTGGWSHEYVQVKTPFCPNCGAKMDLEG